MGIDAIISTLQQNGCSPFFFTSSLQSGMFGELGRQNQAEIMNENMQFKEHLQTLRNEFSREKLDAQKQFRRESLELGRQYLIEQTVLQNESRKKQIEFADFLKNYWPLNSTALAYLVAKQNLIRSKAVAPLTVLIAKTELTSDRRHVQAYSQFCDKLNAELKNLPNAVIEDVPWKNVCQTRLGEAMNINYIMNGIPTLIVFPYQNGDTISIETATWSFGRGLQSMSHIKSLQIEGVAQENIAKVTHLAVKACIGMTRDAFMIAEYHRPAMFNNMIDSEMLSVPAIKKQIESHYEDLGKLIESAEFKELCTFDEFNQIESSLNVKLLNA